MKENVIVELKTVNKLIFHNPERFENKVCRLKAFFSMENAKEITGQRYYVKLYREHNPATLSLETDQ